jgi:hypothetical protein
MSGSRDWVVPPDPKAIVPKCLGQTRGHQLRLVNGGDHFNLRRDDQADGGLLGPLLLAWTDAAFAAGASGSGLGPTRPTCWWAASGATRR